MWEIYLQNQIFGQFVEVGDTSVVMIDTIYKFLTLQEAFNQAKMLDLEFF